MYSILLDIPFQLPHRIDHVLIDLSKSHFVQEFNEYFVTIKTILNQKQNRDEPGSF